MKRFLTIECYSCDDRQRGSISSHEERFLVRRSTSWERFVLLLGNGKNNCRCSAWCPSGETSVFLQGEPSKGSEIGVMSSKKEGNKNVNLSYHATLKPLLHFVYPVASTTRPVDSVTPETSNDRSRSVSAQSNNVACVSVK